MTLSLQLFGAPVLQDNGTPLSLSRRKAMALARSRRMLDDVISAREFLEEAFAMLTHRQWSSLQASCAVSLLELAIDAADVGSADRWFREVSMLEPEHEDLTSLAEKLEKFREGGNR